MSTPVRPADRYGDHTGGTRRRLIAGIAAAAVLVTVAIGFIARASDTRIHAAVLSWTEPRGDAMEATVEVIRRPGTSVACDLIAMDIRQIIVGQTELVAPATPERRLVMTAEIPLQGDAVAASVRGCVPIEPG
jgi:Domain of unknown function (DUF4307)